MTPPIGLRIRTIRRARRLTLKQLGATIDRHQTTIADIETGRAWPGRPRLEAICAALNVTVKQITSDYWRELCARGGISLEEPL